MARVVFLLLIGLVASVFSEQDRQKMSDAQFLESINAPSGRSFNATEKKHDVELQNALAREQQLRKELDDAKTMLEKSAVPAKAFPAVIQASTPDPVQLADQQRAMANRIFGPNGIMNILNPKIMDQNDAAQKLIPQLSLPSASGQQRAGGQPAAAASPFGQQPQGFPAQSGFPQQQGALASPFGQGFGQPMQGMQGQGGFPGFTGQQLPMQQGGSMFPAQSIQQPSYANPFGGGMSANGLGGAGGFGQPGQMQIPQFGGQQGFGR